MKRILKVQEKIGVLSKQSENPFFKSSYLDLNDLLNAVQPLLHEEGLTVIQPIISGSVYTQIIDTNEDSEGCIIQSFIELPDIKDPQKLGSCITYFRRYTLKSLLAIAEKDDDGNLASKPTPTIRKILKVGSKEWDNALKGHPSLDALEEVYQLSEEVKKEYIKQTNK